MFTTAQIVGLAVLTVVVVGVAFILMRLDDAIGTLPIAEEDDSDSTVAAVAVSRPPLPAGGKKRPRSRRRTHS